MKESLMLGIGGVALAAVLAGGGLYQTQVTPIAGSGWHNLIQTNRLTGQVCTRAAESAEPWICDGEKPAKQCDDGTWAKPPAKCDWELRDLAKRLSVNPLR